MLPGGSGWTVLGASASFVSPHATINNAIIINANSGRLTLASLLRTVTLHLKILTTEVTISTGEGQYQEMMRARPGRSVIEEMAADLGIDGIGISDSHPLELAREGFRTAIDRGFIPQATAPKPETLKRLTTPTSHLKGAKSIVSAYESYDGSHPDVADPAHGVIAGYTRSNYYEDLRRRLQRLGTLLEKAFAARSKAFSNYVTLAEKPIAQRAGLGFYGKHGVIITPGHGSFVVLGELITDLEVEPDEPLDTTCGACRLCVDTCPTGAVALPHFVDKIRCIQYLSERRGIIPMEIRRLWKNRLYGCTTCQDVCPHNADIKPVARTVEHGFVGASLPLADVITMDEKRFLHMFAANQIGRREPNAIRRNAIVAAGSIRSEALLPAIVETVRDPDPMIRQHGLWAFARIKGTAARPMLERALEAETDAVVRTEIKTLLDGMAGFA
jgi:epoxyqueuosine reductase